MNKNIIHLWISKAKEVEPGESIFLNCEDRVHSRAICRQFKKELKELSRIDPISASEIKVVTAIRDQRYWVKLKKTRGSPFIGFKKDKDGKTIRIEIDDPERSRRLACMKEDGLTLEEVEDIEGELNEDERRLFEALS